MVKQIIKIVLPSLAVIGIVVAVIYFIQGIKVPPPDDMVTTTYEKKISDRVESDVKDKSYSEAKYAFDDILADINTEASITLSDGRPNLPDEEVLKCRKILFYEYVPIFNSYAKSYFNGHSWDEKTINSIKQEATLLKSMNIAESNSPDYNALEDAIKVVNDYFAAKSLVSKAASCKTDEDVNSLKAKVNSYRRAPLNNNSSLMSQLGGVERTAREAVARYKEKERERQSADDSRSASSDAISQANRVASGYRSYGSYDRFYAAYQQAKDRLNAVKRQHGSTSQINSAISQLDKADDYAQDYYIQ